MFTTMNQLGIDVELNCVRMYHKACYAFKSGASQSTYVTGVTPAANACDGRYIFPDSVGF